MRVLVTGATGFVGSHAAKALQDAGHTVRALARTPAKLETVTARVGVDLDSLDAVHGDICDADAVAAAVDGCDAVVHAARRADRLQRQGPGADPARQRLDDEHDLADVPPAETGVVRQGRGVPAVPLVLIGVEP